MHGSWTSLCWRAALLIVATGLARLAQAQPESEPVSISLPEAVEIALQKSYAMRNARLDIENSEKEIDASWARALPRLDANASYTRNLAVPNPFAGSGAGGFFGGLNAIGWLAFNENARTDGDDATMPISLGEYNQRTSDGLSAAGFTPGSSNLFLVENNVNLGLTATQILYDHSVFVSIRGTQTARDIAQTDMKQQMHGVVRDVASTFYGVLLAEEQVKILDKSVERSRANTNETKKRVEQGVLPQFSLLSAEVELANLETQRLQADNQAQAALDNLKQLLGFSGFQPLSIRGELEAKDSAVTLPKPDQAVQIAYEKRPDIARSNLEIEALEIQEEITWGGYVPVLSLFANLSYQGSIPDNRDQFLEDPPGSFMYRQQTFGPFADDYWFPSANVGLQLTWNIFNGFETTSILAQNRVSTQRARLGLEQLRTSVQLEVQKSLRDLETAQKQIITQARNVARAEENYRHAEIRVREGVSSQIELREASGQLDQSRLSYRQAMHDYLVAKVRYDVAIGLPPVIDKKDEDNP